MSKSETDVHYHFIELLVYWQGRVNSTHLAKQFDFSIPQAKKYLSRYQHEFPQNLRYNPSAKAFLPSDNFCFHYINGDVSEYLDWLQQQPTYVTTGNPSKLTNASLSLPKRGVEPQIMRALVQAMQQQRGVDIDYISMTNPHGQSRIIHPHTFIKTGLRWHLRAYCELRKDYADFVLSRFRGMPEIEDQRSPHNIVDDPQWNQSVSIIFQANTLLAQAQQNIIEQDYQMQGGKLQIECRAALVHYLLQEMQVNPNESTNNPAAQPLVVANLMDIEPYLFERRAVTGVDDG